MMNDIPPLKRLAVLMGLAMVLLIAAAPVRAQVNVTEPFTGTTTSSPNWIIGGGAILTAAQGIDPVGQGWLRLTTNTGNQAGYAIYNSAYTPTQGIKVTFDYTTWGGNGADGISFFLLDGAITSPTIGSFGGSLGYAQETTASGGPANNNGVPSGYVGIGLDEFGNFSNPNEGRVGGPGLTPEAIAIRGSGNLQSGYDYLSGTGTLSPSIDFPGVSSRPSQTGSDYRHVIINITPSQMIYVQMQYGVGGPITTLINGYNLAAATGQVPLPSTLKFGFGSSTGGQNNYHEIRNFNVSPSSFPDMTLALTDGGGFAAGGTGSYTLTATNGGAAAATGLVTVTDTLPSGLTPTAVSGTGWACSVSGQTVTCTRSDTLAAGSAYPPVTLAVSVASAAAPSVTNTAMVSGGGEVNTSNDSASDTTAVAAVRVVLVKRITAVNGVDITGFVSDPVDPDDTNPDWPSPASTYLRGSLNAGSVKPGDIVDYTVYYLVVAGPVGGFTLCDLVPTDMTFVPDSYDGLAPTDGGLSGTDYGIGLASSSSSPPTGPTVYLSDAADSDRGQFYAPGMQAPAAANAAGGFASPLPGGQNTNGVVAVTVVTGSNTLPAATSAGSPPASYGFVRFRARVN